MMSFSKFVAVVLFSVSMTLTGLFVVAPAQAAADKTVHIDCSVIRDFGETVFLAPDERLVVSFECEYADLSINNTGSPLFSAAGDDRTSNPPIITGAFQIEGSGEYTFTAGGITISSGSWAPEMADLRFKTGQVWSYLTVMPRGSDVTVIPGSRLLRSLETVFPETIDTTYVLDGDDFADDSEIASCFGFEDGDDTADYDLVFIASSFETDTAGDITIRTISTNPSSSYTDFLNNIAPYPVGGPMRGANYLLYDSFDPANPFDGFIGCGVEGLNEADYRSTGAVFESAFTHLSATVDAGSYVVVTAMREELDIWNNVGSSRSWAPVAHQSVSTQIWGPAQLADRQPSPSLASTGAHNFVPLAAGSFLAAALLLWGSRWGISRRGKRR